jgi:hypothetical protein
MVPRGGGLGLLKEPPMVLCSLPLVVFGGAGHAKSNYRSWKTETVISTLEISRQVAQSIVLYKDLG